MSGCHFNSLPKEKYPNHFIVAAFSNELLTGKTFLPFKNSCLLTFPDDKAEILTICQFKSY